MINYTSSITQQIPTLDMKIAINNSDIGETLNLLESNLTAGFFHLNLSTTLLFGYRLFVRITFLARGLS